MPKFQVTLNFSFDRNHSDDETEYESNRTSKRKQKAAFNRTDTYYESHDIIDYIKGNDAMEMVGYTPCEAEVLSAEWLPEEFAIQMLVESSKPIPELIEELRMNSLEDGEYEACGETGWILFTRDEAGQTFNGVDGSEDAWEYGLVDYRENEIQVIPYTSND